MKRNPKWLAYLFYILDYSLMSVLDKECASWQTKQVTNKTIKSFRMFKHRLTQHIYKFSMWLFSALLTSHDDNVLTNPKLVT
jgi:hypothetical protein